MKKTCKKVLAGICAAAMLFTSVSALPVLEAKAATITSGEEYITTSEGLSVKFTAQYTGKGESAGVAAGINQTATGYASSTANLADIFDGNNDTGVIFRGSLANYTTDLLAAGDYLQVEFKEAISLAGIEFVFSASSSNDIFKQSTIAYTTDGDTWVDLGTIESSQNMGYQPSEALENVKAVRLTNNVEDGVWVRLVEVKIVESGSAADASKDIAADKIDSYSAGSEEIRDGLNNEGPVRLAFDGEAGTYWHSSWTCPFTDVSEMPKHFWVQIDFKEKTVVDAVRYLPRGTGNGDITGYIIEGTVDGEEWTELTSGSWDLDGKWHIAKFEAAELLGVRLAATETKSSQYPTNNNKFANAVEIRVRAGELPVVVDKTPLVEKLAEVEALVEADYTVDSWAALQVAVEAAQAVIDNEAATEEDVEAAVAALAEAVDNLEIKGPEYTVCDAFDDVPENVWYVSYIQYVYDKGLMVGNKGSFKPVSDITRAHVIVTLYRLAGSPEVTDYSACEELSDVEADQWYTDAVCWAYNEGIATGNVSLMTFNMNAAVTRQQLAAFLYRYAEYADLSIDNRSDLAGLLNVEQIGVYAKDAVEWAVAEGYIAGTLLETDDLGNEVRDLAPLGTATRAQFATILQRFCTLNNL